MYLSPRMVRLAAALLGMLMTLAVPAACSLAPGSPSGASPTISDAWVRPPLGPELPVAGYLTITGGGTADALMRVTSPLASSVEIHETMAGSSGMIGMHPVERIDIDAGGSVRLEPGGYHLMLMGVTEALEVGEMVELRLTFEEAGDVSVWAEVKGG
jgi:copper(I)-binding protein